MNRIFLRRRRKLYMQPGDGGATRAQVAAVQQEIERLGFVLADAAIERLATQSPEALARLLRLLRKELAQATGAHRQHVPLFPDFPDGVLDADEAELYLRAVRHYTTLRRFPVADAQHPPLLSGRAPHVVELGTREEFEAICTQLAASRTSLSAEDKTDLAWFIDQYRDKVFGLLPDAIPFKENVAVIGAALLRGVPGAATDAFLRRHATTATDALRLAVALSGGDVSLAAPTRFGRFARATRRRLLALIDAAHEAAHDLRRRPEPWKRLGERLHPGEYTTAYPHAAKAFAALRDNLPADGFNAAVERELAARAVDEAADRLAERPGELARRLDHLLRIGTNPQRTLDRFAAVGGRVATPVLLQVLCHFTHRGAASLRTFFPKGDAARAWSIPERRAALPAGSAERVVALCRERLLERFARLAPLGRCYVDPALTNFPVPLAQRSASRALRTLVRGSRVPTPDKRHIRLFLWWKNGRGRADIDLSAAFYDAGYTFRDTIAYYNLRGYGGHHSGDIVDAPDGAAEFIDLDLDRLRGMGIRYVVVAIASFTEQPYCDLPECFAGWMARSDIASGEPFEARTVEDRVDIASNQRLCLPFVLDLDAREAIWTDIGLGGRPRWNNVANNLSGIGLTLRAMTSLAKPDLHTLFALHAQARGEPADTPDAADTVFAPQSGITPFDLDRIRAEFL